MNKQEELAAADQAHRNASQALDVATKKYRAREIGDAEYLAVRHAHSQALEDWETAFAAVETDDH